MKIDPDGYKFSVFFLVCAVAGIWGYAELKWPVFLWILCTGMFFMFYTMYFFRDPYREVPKNENAAVSAADGVVVDVSTVEADGFENGEALRIAVFMNVFNVHVNRSPLSGKVIKTIHRNGKKLSAFNKRAEYENEHGDTELLTAWGVIRIRQIAGLIARRVVIRVKAGNELEKGDRIGLIRFGSRVDVFFPKSFVPNVEKGDHISAGKSVIAHAPETN
ncbi:MAG: phosphatidylserine decarboxylase [Candidatus Latescibacteria bacterium]|nr:phosphatidylserine decarboxylase [Candidatus Latescibacterota bacterium]